MWIVLIPLIFLYTLPVSILIEKMAQKRTKFQKTISFILHFVFIGLVLASLMIISLPSIIEDTISNYLTFYILPVFLAVLLYWLLDQLPIPSLRWQIVETEFVLLKRKLLAVISTYWLMFLILSFNAVIHGLIYSEGGPGAYLAYSALFAIPVLFFGVIPISMLIEYVLKKILRKHWHVLSILAHLLIVCAVFYVSEIGYGSFAIFIIFGSICIFLLLDFLIMYLWRQRDSDNGNE